MFLFFCFWKSHFPAERRGFSKRKKKTNKNKPFLALKTGPILLRNILGPVFNASLDQFFTLGFLLFFFVFFVFGWNPYFYSVFSKHAKFKETQKRKKETICEHNCANCSCQNVRFSAFFIFAIFGISTFSEIFWLVSKNQDITKYQSKKKKTKTTTRKQDAKQKQIKSYDSKQNKTTCRKKKQKNSLNKRANTQKQKARARNRNEKQERRKKENNKRETKKRKEKWGRQGFFLLKTKTKNKKKQKKLNK